MDTLTWIAIDAFIFIVLYISIDLQSDFELTRTIYYKYIEHVYKGKHFNF